MTQNTDKELADEVRLAMDALNIATRRAQEAGLRVEFEEIIIETICAPPRSQMDVTCWRGV